MPSTKDPDPLVLELRRAAMVGANERVLVAFSGGPDSTALLIALQEEGHEVVAGHYDHALQEGSAGAAAHAATVCMSRGITLYTERRTQPVPPGSVQAAARTLRYDFLLRTAKRAGAQKIALAHTADDVVEGTVMHLMRGCGIAGLRGMPSRRGPYVRPLINVWRRDVLLFLHAREITAVEDPANSNPKYARVRVRHDLLPALERGRPGITRRFHSVAANAAAMQDRVERAAAAAVNQDPIPVHAIGDLPEPVAVEALRMLYKRAGGPEPALGRAHIEAMLRLLRGGPGGRGVDLPAGLRCRIVDSHVQLVRRVTPAMEALLDVKPCPGCGQVGAAHLRTGLDLHVGFRRPGLRMRPAGGSGTRKLQDIFVDAHIPREARDGWPLVFAGDRLAWVPGIAVDSELQTGAGEPALHVTVTRILAAGRNPNDRMKESPNSPRGESS